MTSFSVRVRSRIPFKPRCRVRSAVIPGRCAGPGPETMHTGLFANIAGPLSWIPCCGLRPRPRNDGQVSPLELLAARQWKRGLTSWQSSRIAFSTRSCGILPPQFSSARMPSSPSSSCKLRSLSVKLSGEPQRMAKRQDPDGDADLDMPGAYGDRVGDAERIRHYRPLRVAVQFGERHRIETTTLGGVNLSERR